MNMDSGSGRKVNFKPLIADVEKASMPQVRFVLSPQGSVVADIDQKLTGDFIFVDADKVFEACSGSYFEQAFAKTVSIDQDLYINIIERYVAKAIALISLARRAGRAVSGHEKAHQLLKDQKKAVPLVASDASIGGTKKFTMLFPHLKSVDVLTSQELGKAFGKEQAFYVGFTELGLITQFKHVVSCLIVLRKQNIVKNESIN